MNETTLLPILVFLAAAAIAAPLGKLSKISSVLGYLLAGILIGPFGLGQIHPLFDVETTLHIAEFGVIFLLFTIGLELRPQRLWSMRAKIFGLGGAQVLLSGFGLTGFVLLTGLGAEKAALIGAMLALSSTAFVLQLLEEKGELQARHGRLAFAILLFQDLAAIPMLVIVPLFAADLLLSSSTVGTAAFNLLVVAVVVLFGRTVLAYVLRLVAETRMREAMTATSLFVVVGVALLMHWAGLSAALGAFLAGVLFAGSSFRHQLEADVAPFKGLFLALFFIAVGMSLDLRLIGAKPVLIFSSVFLLLAVKIVILYSIARFSGLNSKRSRRLALILSQSGEFAFVILTTAVSAKVLDAGLSSTLAVIVTLSMAMTPLLLVLDELLFGRKQSHEPAYEVPPKDEGHVVIAGFGRFGQIVARILHARKIRFTALDRSSKQVDFVADFGDKIYYGDASRLDILEAAQTGKAQAFVLATADVEGSLQVAKVVRDNYPNIPIFARARNRTHVYRLMDLGVEIIERDTYLSSLDISRKLLKNLGFSERDAMWSVDTFQAHDERRLYRDYKHFSDMDKIKAHARKEADELKALFTEDAAEQAKLGERPD